jgi:cardiolipin synthase C
MTDRISRNIVWLLGLLVVATTNIPLRADSLQLLHGELEAFQQRIQLIDEAASEISLVYYEIADDSTSGHLLAALLRAVERGVRVRLLVDGHIGSSVLPKALVQRLLDRGVLVRERPLDVRYKLEIGRLRLHDKLLIVDRTKMVLGGRNLEQEYFGLGDRKYIDRDVAIAGETAEKASQYFDSRWDDPAGGVPNLVRPEKRQVVKRQKHPEWNCMPRDQAFVAIDQWLLECEATSDFARDRCGAKLTFPSLDIESCRVRFLHDFVGASKSCPAAIAPSLLRLIDQAKSSIELETPYLVVTNELKSRLMSASRRGVRIRILTNSLESTDQVAAHAGYANERRWMLRAGIALFELQGRDILHAKSMVIDGVTTMVGSYNFDPLSERRNSETAIVVTDPTFASQVLNSIQDHRRFSRSIEQGNLLRLEARESQASEDLIRQMRRLRFVTPLIERYL